MPANVSGLLRSRNALWVPCAHIRHTTLKESITKTIPPRTVRRIFSSHRSMKVDEFPVDLFLLKLDEYGLLDANDVFAQPPLVSCEFYISFSTVRATSRLGLRRYRHSFLMKSGSVIKYQS